MTPIPPLADQVAVVTGAAGGIGRSISQRFAEAGASVYLADIREGAAAALADDLSTRGWRASAYPVDIADPGSTDALSRHVLEETGRVDILVACAGIDAPRGHAWDLTEEHWRRIIDVDLSGSWWTVRAFLPVMVHQKSGKVILISSVAARAGEPDLSVAYNAAKAGLIGLTVGLAVQLEPYGIRVNAVAPGPTGTGEPMAPRERDAYVAAHPLGIVGPDPVADACLYLAGPSGDWISGSVMNVSGGMLHGW